MEDEYRGAGVADEAQLLTFGDGIIDFPEKSEPVIQSLALWGIRLAGFGHSVIIFYRKLRKDDCLTDAFQLFPEVGKPISFRRAEGAVEDEEDHEDSITLQYPVAGFR